MTNKSVTKTQSYSIPIIKEYFCGGSKRFSIVGHEVINETYTFQYLCGTESGFKANSFSARVSNSVRPLILDLQIAGVIIGNSSLEASASQPELCGEPDPKQTPGYSFVEQFLEQSGMGSYDYKTYSYSIDGDGFLIVSVTYIKVVLNHNVVCTTGKSQISNATASGSVGGSGNVMETRITRSQF